MKRFFITILSVMMTSLAIQAQTTFMKADGLKPVRQHSAVESMLKAKPGKAPLKAINLAENERVMGYFNDESYDENGVGLGTGRNIKVGCIMTPSVIDKFKGSTLKRMRFALIESLGGKMPKNFKIHVFPLNENSILPAVAEMEIATPQNGWNDITLDTPVEIKNEYTDLMLAYSYLDEAGSQGPAVFPIAMNKSAKMPAGNQIIFCKPSQKHEEGWYDVGLDDFGALAIQGIVEMKEVPEQEVVLNGIATDAYWYKKSSTLKVGTNVYSFGKTIPTDYTINIAIDGNSVGKLNSPVALTETEQQIVTEVTIPENIEDGIHSITMEIESVSGNAQDKKYVQTGEIATYTNGYDRQKYLVEQFTAQNCSACPYGEKFLSAMTKKYSDIAWVAVHGAGMGADKFNFEEINNLEMYFQIMAYPTASFNRVDVMSEGALATGIGFKESYHDQISTMIYETWKTMLPPAFVKLGIESSFDATTRELTIKVKGDCSDMLKKIYGEDAVLNIYLTEDGQTAYQAGSGYSHTHNNILRQFVTTYKGQPLMWTENGFENDYSLTLNKSWNESKMHIVAFVTRKLNEGNLDIRKAEVNNAEKVKLGESTSTGIDQTVLETADAKEVARYTVDGHKLDRPTKGLNIVKLSNGKTLKVMVK